MQVSKGVATAVRLLALFFICFSTFGSYYMYDQPGIIGFDIPCTADTDPPACFHAPAPHGAAPELAPYLLGGRDDACPQAYDDNATACELAGPDCALAYDRDADGPSFGCMNVVDGAMDFDTCMADCWRVAQRNVTGTGVLGLFAVRGADQCSCSPLQDVPQNESGLVPSDTCTVPCAGNDVDSCGGVNATAASIFNCPIATIQQVFVSHGQHYSAVDNQLLYSVYSYPNTILCLVGGLLIDRVGLRPASLLFAALVTGGQCLFALAVSLRNYPLMVVARVLYGLGGESLSVAQSAFTARWFGATRFCALAFGVTLSFARFGSAISFVIAPLIVAASSVVTSLWFGASLCLFSLLCIVLLNLLDVWASRKGILPPASSAVTSSSDRVKLRDVLRLPADVYLLAAVCVSFYIAVFPFNGFATVFLRKKYRLTRSVASASVSAYTITSAVASPFIGLAIDWVGRPLLFMCSACAIAATTYILFWLTTVEQLVPLIILGLGLSLMSSTLWPAVAYVVPLARSGTAYGFVMAVQNLGLATLPAVIGVVLDLPASQLPSQYGALARYYYAMWLLLGCAVICFVLCLLLVVVDRATTGGILLVNPQRRVELGVKMGLSPTVLKARSSAVLARSSVVFASAPILSGGTLGGLAVDPAAAFDDDAAVNTHDAERAPLLK